ncbi:MAG TPA: sulfite reductase subunit alpha [Opitutaceae bacterium]|nr:sulfite reductase subunit alpha [Opitutaceae bacterium]
MSASAVASSTYNKDHPFPARITENRLLSRPGSSKETRHFVVSLAGSGLHYKAGDSLGIYPMNRPSEVEAILKALGATGEEPIMLPKATEPMPLREALHARLSLSDPTRKIVEVLHGKATNADERARLGGLLAPESKEVLAAFLAEREFIDLLIEFPSAHLSPQELVEQLRRLMPRLYSIASSPKIHPTEIHLTVAVVRYESNRRERHGVCTTFLADRVQVGRTEIPVFISHSHFRPPEDHSKDCIMVGPGTGIAPFRAFVQDRSAEKGAGRNWIFFGDQHAATDFLYEEEWQGWKDRKQLHRLDLAWSRDQATKIYVQDRMRENASELWAWIEAGAHFYVCGDAKRMAKDVDQMLHSIIADKGGMTLEGAAEYVKQMKKDKRYQRDVY